jgi:hypothetical protein
VVLVIARLIQRTPARQALAGLLGVALGAVWAWRAGEAGAFFVPGLWINGAYLVGVLASMIARWPVAGIVVGLARGVGSSWRDNPAWMRRSQLATAVLAGVFVLRLLVQVPLYLADQVAALGTAKLAMGLPLFAVALWVMWLLVRPVGQPQAPQDPPPPTR